VAGLTGLQVRHQFAIGGDGCACRGLLKPLFDVAAVHDVLPPLLTNTNLDAKWFQGISKNFQNKK
jgi:hypothetical protein